jgi:hypothetical protein
MRIVQLAALLLVLLVIYQPAHAGFAHAQTSMACSDTSSPASGTTCGFGSNPATGDPVAIMVALDSGLTSVGLADCNSNTLVATANSPATSTTVGEHVYAFVYNTAGKVAPSNACKTYTASWTGSASFLFVLGDDFSVSGGTASFDKDVAASNATSGAAGQVTLPSITPANSASLLWTSVSPNAYINAPTAGSTQGVWTGGAQTGAGNGPATEYELSGTGATATNMTDNSATDAYAGMAVAFKFTASGGSCTPTLTLMGVGRCG